jgi:hypothetical protein
MKTCSPPHPANDLPTHLYYQLVYTPTDLLPPPLDDTPEGPRAKNHAAIAKVGALLPVNANEAVSRRPMHRRPRPGQADAAAAPSARRRHRVGDATKHAIRIDGATIAGRARTPDAGAGVAPEAGGDRWRGESGREGSACRRTVYAALGRTQMPNRSRRPCPKRHRSRRGSNRQRLAWARALRKTSQKSDIFSGRGF